MQTDEYALTHSCAHAQTQTVRSESESREMNEGEGKSQKQTMEITSFFKRLIPEASMVRS